MPKAYFKASHLVPREVPLPFHPLDPDYDGTNVWGVLGPGCDPSFNGDPAAPALCEVMGKLGKSNKGRKGPSPTSRWCSAGIFRRAAAAEESGA